MFRDSMHNDAIHPIPQVHFAQIQCTNKASAKAQRCYCALQRQMPDGSQASSAASDGHAWPDVVAPATEWPDAAAWAIWYGSTAWRGLGDGSTARRQPVLGST